MTTTKTPDQIGQGFFYAGAFDLERPAVKHKITRSGACNDEVAEFHD